MGLFEPLPAANSNLTDGYAAERGLTNTSFTGQSYDWCSDPAGQTLPSDGTWPYQSVQYSLPCASMNSAYLTATTTGKKISWGSASFYGFNLTSIYNGQTSYNINNFPGAPYKLNYSVCLVLDTTNGDPQPIPFVPRRFKRPPPPIPLTIANAALYTTANPTPSESDCATTTP